MHSERSGGEAAIDMIRSWSRGMELGRGSRCEAERIKGGQGERGMKILYILEFK